MDGTVIYFNGIDLEKKRAGESPYHFPPKTVAAFLSENRVLEDPDPRLNAMDVIEGIDPTSLAETGWGLIVHESEDKEVLEALAPLLQKRRRDAGAMYREMTFYNNDTTESFRKRNQAASGDANPKKLPYYLLIVGSPELIPFSFQTDLDFSYAVGRLTFHRVESYRQYAANVVKHENEPKPHPHRFHLFAVNNGEPLTELSCNRLAAPIQEALAERSGGGSRRSWAIEATPPQEATRHRLLSLFSPETKPDILFTAGHGVVYDGDTATRERLQGGLVCSDWQAGRPPSEQQCLFGHDLTPDMDFSGLIWFFFSCYTAGTPALSITRSPDQKADRLHPHSFVASLPRALLAHERGALAVVGHVEQCYQHSFLWHDEIGETDHFASALARLLEGVPVGYAMEHFQRRLGEIATAYLGRMHDPNPPDEEEMRLFWITFQDARYYIVLGDPAVRLGGAV